MTPVLSLVVPVYNEERNIHAFLAAATRAIEAIGESFEIVFVDDGSKDGSLGLLVAATATDSRVKVVSFARNFGKETALAAGLAHASGDAVIPIDCDLQHPPELIAQMVTEWKKGADMVLAVRSKRTEESWPRRTASGLYYRVLRWLTSVDIPAHAGDFRLISRKVVDVLNQMPERHRFMKGIYAWPGFTTATIEFQAAERADQGGSKWSFFKLWRFALDGIFSFSTMPLKVWTYVGLVCAAGSFIYLLITIVQVLWMGIDVPGYASVLSVLLFFNGLSIISNGIQGEYLARIFEEVKGRPLYVVGGRWGFSSKRLEAVDAKGTHASAPTAVRATASEADDSAA
jgi:glycosyltransferase involved in cell wall biosynthesis